MEKLTELLFFRVTKDMLKDAKKLAAREERKLSDVLRRLLVQALKEK